MEVMLGFEPGLFYILIPFLSDIFVLTQILKIPKKNFFMAVVIANIAYVLALRAINIGPVDLEPDQVKLVFIGLNLATLIVIKSIIYALTLSINEVTKIVTAVAVSGVLTILAMYLLQVLDIATM